MWMSPGVYPAAWLRRVGRCVCCGMHTRGKWNAYAAHRRAPPPGGPGPQGDLSGPGTTSSTRKTSEVRLETLLRHFSRNLRETLFDKLESDQKHFLDILFQSGSEVRHLLDTLSQSGIDVRQNVVVLSQLEKHNVSFCLCDSACAGLQKCLRSVSGSLSSVRGTCCRVFRVATSPLRTWAASEAASAQRWDEKPHARCAL